MAIQEPTCTSIHGYQVSFPYRPYDVQLNYMDKTIDACENGKFALLESPTGTGKTLSLLCSTLAWKEQTHYRCQIVYSSRTHSQLSNVIEELKKTRFKPRVAHIASRKMLCINHTINKYDNFLITRLCHNLRSKKQCPYGIDENLMSNSNEVLTACSDIEEYIENCANHMICPYFAAQINSEQADLILTPYTYIVDPNVRQFLPSTTLVGNVLIFDEAHNFADTCSEAYSAKIYFKRFNDAALTLMKIEPNRFSNATRNSKAKVNGNDLLSTRAILMNIFQKCDTLENTDYEYKTACESVSSSAKSVLYVKKTAEQLYAFFRDAGLTKENSRLVYSVLDLVVQKGDELQILNNEFGSMQSIMSFIDLIFPNATEAVEMFDSKFSILFTTNRTISIICFSPSIAMKKVADFLPKTMILTSGTLSPLSSLEDELEYKFPIKLECNHIVSPDNFLVAIANSGISGQRFNFTYQNRRGNNRLESELVDSVTDVFKVSPSGALLFFPSFSYMDEVSRSISSNASRVKRIYIEAKDAVKQATVLENYKRDAMKGAALLAVCRGRSSEGLDFVDDFARFVGVVGIPYPTFTDYTVELKREWLENKKPGKGLKWYTECAVRAVNQSIGRAIRHIDDYAAIVLFDERFTGLKDQLSKWMQQSIYVYDDWSTLTTEIDQFFRAKKEGFLMKRKGRSATQSQRTVTFSQSADSDDFSQSQMSQASQQESFFQLSQQSTIKKKEESKPKPLVYLKQNKKVEKSPSNNSLTELLSQRKDSERSSSNNSLSQLLSQRKSSDKPEKEKISRSKSDVVTEKPSLLTGLLTSGKKHKIESEPKPVSILKPKEKKEPSPPEEIKIVCVNCKEDKKKNLSKMHCGHYICSECKQFFKMLNMKCPICKK